jgi:ribosomal protein L37AE/L43A
MSRKRMIDPGVWEDEGFLELTIAAKLLFLGMISQADDEGRGLASSKSLKAKILPGENLTTEQVDSLKREIAENLNVDFYSDAEGSREYYALRRWKDYQYIKDSRKSTIPAPSRKGSSGPEAARKRPDPGPTSAPNTIQSNPIQDNTIQGSVNPEKSTHRANSDELGKEKEAEPGAEPPPKQPVTPEVPPEPPRMPAPVGRFAPPGGLLGGILARAAAGKPQPAERHHRSPEEREERGQIRRATGPWKELSPLARGEFKQPLKCPKCGHLTDYFPHRDGDRYNSEVWICSKDSGGCGSKFKGAQWEDREGKLTPKRSKDTVHIDPDRKAQLTVLPKYREYLEPEEDGPHVEVPRV